MASVCLSFEVHQPARLRRYSVFDTDPSYFDHQANAEILKKVAESCYLPAVRRILDLVVRHDGRFRLAFSISGTVIEQWRAHCPQLIELFGRLARSGCVELLGETYHHSLAFFYSRAEFRAQVDLHARLMEDLFGQVPRVFCHTELIYNNDLSAFLRSMGQHHGILTVGSDQFLGDRRVDHPYHPPGATNLNLLLRNNDLSDDVSKRFSDRTWARWPLDAEKFAQWIDRINANGHLCNLFMDFESFGEHHSSDTGILDFLNQLPESILTVGGGSNDFKTPSECIAAYEPAGEFDVPRIISRADPERDLSNWLGNAMQSNALHELYKLEQPVKDSGDPQLLDDWRNLTSADHSYYMCTKYFAADRASKTFNPYESPYDSYINFMNVLDNVRSRTER